MWQKIKVWWLVKNKQRLYKSLKYSKVYVTDTCARVVFDDGLELFYHATIKDEVKIPIRKDGKVTIYPYDGWGQNLV
jgi:hypothetical protein